MAIKFPLRTTTIRFDFMKADGSVLSVFDIVIDEKYSGEFNVPRIGESVNYTPHPDSTQYIGEVAVVRHSIQSVESPLGATQQIRIELKNSQKLP